MDMCMAGIKSDSQTRTLQQYSRFNGKDKQNEEQLIFTQQTLKEIDLKTKYIAIRRDFVCFVIMIDFISKSVKWFLNTQPWIAKYSTESFTISTKCKKNLLLASTLESKKFRIDWTKWIVSEKRLILFFFVFNSCIVCRRWCIHRCEPNAMRCVYLSLNSDMRTPI